VSAELPSKRGAPWALLAVLGGIGLGTTAMCGVGGWLLVNGVQSTVQATTEAAEAGRGPLEVRSEAYRVVMRRSAEETDVELFDGVLAQYGLNDSILRRLEPGCHVQLRVRTVGADAEVVTWMDFIANGVPDGEPTAVHIEGLDTEALQREYKTFDDEPFRVVGFVHGDIFFALDVISDDPDCASRASASIELLGGEMALSIASTADVSGPTFRIVGNRFESSVSGLVIDAPAPFTFASGHDTNLWFEEDEAILLHPNGSEIHVSTRRVWEGDLESTCESNVADERSVAVQFEDTARVFGSAYATPPNRSLNASFCIGQTLVTITAVGPNSSRGEQALRALENRVHLQTPELHDEPGHQRAGLHEWRFRDDIYQHLPSGMTWRRPDHAEVRTGIVQRHDSYPEAHVQFEFQRRDVGVMGAGWAHPTALSASDYHEAFVAASLAQLGANDFERVDQPVEFDSCSGTRSSLTRHQSRNIVVTCAHDGWGVAMEARVIRTELEGAIEFADAALAAITIAPVADRTSYRVDGANVDDIGDACTLAAIQSGRLTLNVASCMSWSPTHALFNAVAASDGSGALMHGLGRVERSRLFAATTPVTPTQVSGFHAEARRFTTMGQQLRVYTVLVDATAYVITLRGPASTPESTWSELLATVHIDP